MPKDIFSLISSMFEKNNFALPGRISVNARIAEMKDSSQSETKHEYHACLVSTHNIETQRQITHYPNSVLPKAFQIH